MRKLLPVLLSVVMILSSCDASMATEGPGDIPGTAQPTFPSGELTPAELAAVEALASNRGVPVDEIRVVSTEAVDWPDGCLGVVDTGLACAEVVTPGYHIVLEAEGREVEYRTNVDGTHLRAATVALTWSREGGFAGFCDSLTVYLSGEVHASSCKQGQYTEERLIDLLSAEELAQFDGWLKEYGTLQVDASDPNGVADRMIVLLSFMGNGSRHSLSQSTEHDLLQFAQDLHQRMYR